MSALNPSGIRIGTPAITTRGLKENDMVYLADILDRTIKIGIIIQKTYNPKTIKEFVVYFRNYKELENLKIEVHNFMMNKPFYN